jgi:hypothetical protein
MRKRRLALVLGACLATAALTAGTALADPNPAPPPYPPVEGSGAQTTEGVLNDFCNNKIFDPVTGNSTCGSWDVEGSSTITTRDPASHPECNNIHRALQGGDGFTQLTNLPTCYDFARTVTGPPTGAPAGFTFIPMATDALTYAVRSDGTVPLNLTDAQLKAIYTCAAGTSAFKPLIGQFGAGNRTLFFQKLGITDSSNYTTLHPCVRDKDANGVGLLANDGRVLTDKANLITYSSAPYFAQLNRVEPDIHAQAVLGSINGIPPEVLNAQSFIARPVYNAVRTSDVPGPGPVHDIFVGPTSKICSDPTTIAQHGFNPLSNCGDTSLVTN